MPSATPSGGIAAGGDTVTPQAESSVRGMDTARHTRPPSVVLARHGATAPSAARYPMVAPSNRNPVVSQPPKDARPRRGRSGAARVITAVGDAVPVVPAVGGGIDPLPVVV